MQTPPSLGERHVRDIPDRRRFFDQISTMKSESWQPGSITATASAGGRRVAIKIVDYQGDG